MEAETSCTGPENKAALCLGLAVLSPQGLPSGQGPEKVRKAVVSCSCCGAWAYAVLQPGWGKGGEQGSSCLSCSVSGQDASLSACVGESIA